MSSTSVVNLEISNGIAIVSLNRPSKSNAINAEMLESYSDTFKKLNAADVRCAILVGEGKNFCAGLDLNMFGQVLGNVGESTCEGRKRFHLLSFIEDMQRAFEAAERCRVPVIAVVHGACIGGGLDIISACDIVYASRDTQFSLKEVDLGITADMGSLQRLPRRGIPLGTVREWAYTARKFSADEAHRAGLVAAVFDSRDAAIAHARTVAREIAQKSPLTVVGTKAVLTHARDHPVAAGLQHVALWNAAHVISADSAEAVTAALQRRTPQFARL